MITSVVEAIYDDYAKVNFTNYELRREDFNQLAAFARQFKDLNEFLSQLALISNVDAEAAPNQGADKEAVNFSSVHQAKGLEFRAVFVIWLTDGMFPSARSLDTREALEEERRLFYVAVTRARDELYLAFPHMRLGRRIRRGFSTAVAVSEGNPGQPRSKTGRWKGNDEALMTNDEGSPNVQMTKRRRQHHFAIWTLAFGFRHCFVIRRLLRHR